MSPRPPLAKENMTILASVITRIINRSDPGDRFLSNIFNAGLVMSLLKRAQWIRKKIEQLLPGFKSGICVKTDRLDSVSPA